MEVTVDLEPEVYQEAQRRATEQGISVGEYVSQAVLDYCREHYPHLLEAPEPIKGFSAGQSAFESQSLDR